MGYKRHVVTSTLPYDHFSIAIDETRAAFRVLDKKIFFEVPEDTPASPIEELIGFIKSMVKTIAFLRRLSSIKQYRNSKNFGFPELILSLG